MRLIDADALIDALMAYTWRDEDERLIDDADEKREFIKNWMPDLPTVGGWISVKDRMPKEEGRYIVYADKGVKSAFYETYEGESRWTDEGERYWDIHVTHWMPLPEPPKEKEND